MAGYPAMWLYVIAFCLVRADAGSAVQKVVELLEECKGKVEADLAAESKQMEEYTQFCDNELKDKAYAIQTATRTIEDLSATVQDSDATITVKASEIVDLGTLIAAKESELAKATSVREGEHKDFGASEKELVKSIDQLSRAASLIKKGTSFAQIKTRGGKSSVQVAVEALQSIIESQWLDLPSRKHLRSFLQATTDAKESEDDDLSFNQPQAKTIAYESSSGGILKTIEDMQDKAEDTLSDLRKTEMEATHTFESLAGNIKQEIDHSKDKLSAATQTKAAAEQTKEDSNKKLVATESSKTADEDYAKTLKTECEKKAAEWESRVKSAKGEMGAIDKAKEILEEGVKAFVQVSTKIRRVSNAEDDEDAAEDATRARLSDFLQKLNQKHHSFALTQLSSMTTAGDPFEKIKGLIEDMISKLLKEAQEAATHQAFCQEEMGKSKKAQDVKTNKQAEYQSRIDNAATAIAELTESIKQLETEVAEIDKAQAEATAIRVKEHEEFLKASKDFKDSAEAVAKAMEVLKNFYEGSFIQLRSSTMVVSKLKSKQPEFGGAKSDTASTIISVLEMSQDDFTSLLAESEETEADAVKAFDKMTSENKVAKASKETESKAKASEVKSLKVSLEHSKEDHSTVSQELDAVAAYIAKLKPECESKAMSYEEKKAAREAEIQGLKEALQILDGTGVALAQTSRKLRIIKQLHL